MRFLTGYMRFILTFVVDPREGAGPAESPVLPAGCESSESLSLGFHVPHPPLPQVQAPAQTGKPASPKIPSAPTQPTIPLPDASPDFRAARIPNTIQPQLEIQLSEQNSAFTIYDLPLPSSQAQARSAPFSFAPVGPSPSSTATTFDMGQKTPNVYINGLPPHFPEDQLFALASPFGEIRSVRTFTRHVRDSESGYGFVLYVFFPSLLLEF